MKAEQVLVVCLVSVGAAFAVAAIVSVAFYVRLKRYEHDVWISLGSPMAAEPIHSVAHDFDHSS